MRNADFNNRAFRVTGRDLILIVGSVVVALMVLMLGMGIVRLIMEAVLPVEIHELTGWARLWPTVSMFFGGLAVLTALTLLTAGRVNRWLEARQTTGEEETTGAAEAA